MKDLQVKDLNKMPKNENLAKNNVDNNVDKVWSIKFTSRSPDFYEKLKIALQEGYGEHFS